MYISYVSLWSFTIFAIVVLIQGIPLSDNPFHTIPLLESPMFVWCLERKSWTQSTAVFGGVKFEAHPCGYSRGRNFTMYNPKGSSWLMIFIELTLARINHVGEIGKTAQGFIGVHKEPYSSLICGLGPWWFAGRCMGGLPMRRAQLTYLRRDFLFLYADNGHRKIRTSLSIAQQALYGACYMIGGLKLHRLDSPPLWE